MLRCRNLSVLNEQSIDIIIDYDAYQAIRNYAQNNLSQELKGVLVGNWEQTDSGINVYVKGAVDAQFTKPTKSAVKFTRRTWQYVNGVKKRYFTADDKIIGWFSSHPGFGLFLTRPDDFTGDSHAELPGQVAFVLDPVGEKEGFFYWQDNTVARCNYQIEELGYGNGGYHLQPVIKGGAKNIPQGKLLLAGFCLMLVAAMSYYAGLLQGKSVSDDGNNQQQPPKSEFIGDQLTRDPGKKQVTPTAVSDTTKTIYEHQVKPGENLWNISWRYYNNGDGMEKIAEFNNLPNIRDLTPGQILMIPDVEKIKKD